MASAAALLKQDFFESHSTAPSSAKKYGAGRLGMATALTGRKLPEQHEQRITKAHAAERVSSALQAWGKDKSAPISRIQYIASVDRKTAEAWWHGRNPPQFEHMVNLGRRIPELQAEVRRLFHMDADIDPEFQRAFCKLMQMMGQR